MSHFTRPQVVAILDPQHQTKFIDGDTLVDLFDEYEDTGFEPKLGFLYRSINCSTVDCREIYGVCTLWFDDEGKMKNIFLNKIATSLFHADGYYGDYIMGNVVVVFAPHIDASRARALIQLVEQSTTHISAALAAMKE